MLHLICPVCAEVLSNAGGSLVCGLGHTFDRAREGYVDLLPQGYGRAGIAGDSAEMVAARRRFLAAGHYGRLLDAVIARVREHVGKRNHLDEPRSSSREAQQTGLVVLDVGCGDGYYGGNVAEALAGEHGACRLYGLDISRAALKLAARAWRDGVFFRNDTATRICLAEDSAEVLLDIFAPRNADEFARVLRPGGLAVIVIPDESHLQELRAALPLLSIQPEKSERITAQFDEHFILEAQSAIHYTMPLTPPELTDLITMSPSAHHINNEQLGHLHELETTASFHVLTFVRETTAGDPSLRSG